MQNEGTEEPQKLGFLSKIQLTNQNGETDVFQFKRETTSQKSNENINTIDTLKTENFTQLDKISTGNNLLQRDDQKPRELPVILQRGSTKPDAQSTALRKSSTKGSSIIFMNSSATSPQFTTHEPFFQDNQKKTGSKKLLDQIVNNRTIPQQSKGQATVNRNSQGQSLQILGQIAHSYQQTEMYHNKLMNKSGVFPKQNNGNSTINVPLSHSELVNNQSEHIDWHENNAKGHFKPETSNLHHRSNQITRENILFSTSSTVSSIYTDFSRKLDLINTLEYRGVNGDDLRRELMVEFKNDKKGGNSEKLYFKSLIPAEQQVLDPNNWNYIENTPSENVYFSIKLKDKSSPLKIFIKTDNAEHVFQIFYSRHSTMPGEKGSEKIIHSQSSIVIEAGNQLNHFQQENCYFCYFSATKQIVKLQVHFGKVVVDNYSMINSQTIAHNKQQMMQQEKKRLADQQLALGDAAIVNPTREQQRKQLREIFKKMTVQEYQKIDQIYSNKRHAQNNSRFDIFDRISFSRDQINTQIENYRRRKEEITATRSEEIKQKILNRELEGIKRKLHSMKSNMIKLIQSLLVIDVFGKKLQRIKNSNFFLMKNGFRIISNIKKFIGSVCIPFQQAFDGEFNMELEVKRRIEAKQDEELNRNLYDNIISKKKGSTSQNYIGIKDNYEQKQADIDNEEENKQSKKFRDSLDINGGNSAEERQKTRKSTHEDEQIERKSTIHNTEVKQVRRYQNQQQNTLLSHSHWFENYTPYYIKIHHQETSEKVKKRMQFYRQCQTDQCYNQIQQFQKKNMDAEKFKKISNINPNQKGFQFNEMQKLISQQRKMVFLNDRMKVTFLFSIQLLGSLHYKFLKRREEQKLIKVLQMRQTEGFIYSQMYRFYYVSSRLVKTIKARLMRYKTFQQCLVQYYWKLYAAKNIDKVVKFKGENLTPNQLRQKRSEFVNSLEHEFVETHFMECRNKMQQFFILRRMKTLQKENSPENENSQIDDNQNQSSIQFFKYPDEKDIYQILYSLAQKKISTGYYKNSILLLQRIKTQQSNPSESDRDNSYSNHKF